MIYLLVTPNGPNGRSALHWQGEQEFVDERTFYNAVTLFGGALRVALRAEREIIDDERIRVAFKETSLTVFGRTLLRRPSPAGGVWEQR